jgi:hypothetical protein
LFSKKIMTICSKFGTARAGVEVGIALTVGSGVTVTVAVGNGVSVGASPGVAGAAHAVRISSMSAASFRCISTNLFA